MAMAAVTATKVATIAADNRLGNDSSYTATDNRFKQMSLRAPDSSDGSGQPLNFQRWEPLNFRSGQPLKRTTAELPKRGAAELPKRTAAERPKRGTAELTKRGVPLNFRSGQPLYLVYEG